MAHHFLIPALLFLLLQSGRAAVPDPAKQKEAEKTVKELFKAEYAKKAPADRRELAHTLLAQAEKTADDPALQWVLLREARDLALQGGDLDAAVMSDERAGKTFEIDPLALRAATLGVASKAAKAPDELGALAEKYLRLAEDAAAADNYEVADKSASTALQMSRAANNPIQVNRATLKSKEIADAKKGFAALKRAKDALAQNPADGPANLEIGQFLCFVKGDWETGREFLTKGSDAKLKALAEKDLAKPAEAPDQIAVGDGWWDLAEAEKAGSKKDKLQIRARFWYEQALPNAQAIARVKIEKRLASLDAIPGDPLGVNLLALIDLKLDVSTGEWTRNGQTLVAPATGTRMWVIRLPYSLPPEYDLRLVVKSPGAERSLDVGLVGPSGQFTAIIDAPNVSGLHILDGKGWNLNETAHKGKIFTDDKPKTLIFSVRKAGVSVSVDNNPIINWKGEFSRLACDYPNYDVKEKKHLFLAAWQAYQFSRIDLIPVSGQGKKIR